MNLFGNLRINSGEKLNWLEKIVLHGLIKDPRMIEGLKPHSSSMMALYYIHFCNNLKVPCDSLAKYITKVG
jgi:hypothetical protein